MHVSDVLMSYITMAAVWQHPEWANLKRYSSLLSAQAGPRRPACVHRHTHGRRVQLPWCAVIQRKNENKEQEKRKFSGT